MWESFIKLTAKEVSNCWVKAGLLGVRQAQLVCNTHDRSIPKCYSTIVGAAACAPEELSLQRLREESSNRTLMQEEEIVDELLALDDTICDTDPNLTSELAKDSVQS